MTKYFKVIDEEDGLTCFLLCISNFTEENYEEELMEVAGYVSQDVRDNFMDDEIVEDLIDNGFEAISVREFPEGVEVEELFV